MSQLDLLTGEPVPEQEPVGEGVTLTPRQALALDHIAARQPVSSDELGAFLHEDRMRRGGKGHGRDERCDWCPGEGREMGEALKRRGLVVRKKTIGWCLPDYQAVAGGPSSQNATGEGLDEYGLPRGF